jgi:hypothetical protein
VAILSLSAVRSAEVAFFLRPNHQRRQRAFRFAFDGQPIRAVTLSGQAVKALRIFGVAVLPGEGEEILLCVYLRERGADGGDLIAADPPVISFAAKPRVKLADPLPPDRMNIGASSCPRQFIST